jgi:hypothetical protein
MRFARAMATGAMWAACSLQAGSLHPPSPVIRGLEWDPPATVRRAALDGDNWPVTWGQDDAIYTTWGDGTGFDPKVAEKLSCGYARVTGGPEDFRGENLFSLNEQPGQGRNGLKAWGLLAVGEVLYAWFGHADKRGGAAQLAWSDNGARTFQFADWHFPEFGLMGFINFGRAYAGARDDYVYAYSHDGPKADRPADRFVLMRVPKQRLQHREAYEFFAGLDERGQPAWSADIGRRRGVFTRPDGCLRSAITYHAGLRRYLWWQAFPQPPGHRDRGDTRFAGGFAVYDAPEPWGPWTTVFHTDNWDMGPGEHGDFPAKWSDPAGESLWLVFSGEDAFSVRRARVLRWDAPKTPTLP